MSSLITMALAGIATAQNPVSPNSQPAVKKPNAATTSSKPTSGTAAKSTHAGRNAAHKITHAVKRHNYGHNRTAKNSSHVIFGSKPGEPLITVTNGRASNRKDIGTGASLFQAADANDVAKLKTLLKRNPRLVHYKDNDGWTALHHAAAAGNLEVAEVLLTNHANGNAKDNHGVMRLDLAMTKRITLTGSDPDNPALPLTFAVATRPAQGDLAVLNSETGVVIYTPDANYHSADSFTFTVNNGTNTSSPVAATLNVVGGG
jgi:hypothetical protein